MRSQGHLYEFVPQPWASVAAECADRDGLTGIVGSIESSEFQGQLAGALWASGLAVAALPLTGPPLDILLVTLPTPKSVRITHQTSTGRNDVVERPLSDAIPLFWRFVYEKFGMTNH